MFLSHLLEPKQVEVGEKARTESEENDQNQTEVVVPDFEVAVAYGNGSEKLENGLLFWAGAQGKYGGINF